MSNLLLILFIIYVVNKFFGAQHFPTTGGEWPTNKERLPRRLRPIEQEQEPVEQRKHGKDFFEGKQSFMKERQEDRASVQGPGAIAAQVEASAEAPQVKPPAEPGMVHLSRQELVNGIILGEILGPPKARRQRPR